MNHPYYKVVVTDKRSPRDGKFIEIIGNYDPKQTGDNSKIDLDAGRSLDQVRRAALGHGAQHHQESTSFRPAGGKRRLRD